VSAEFLAPEFLTGELPAPHGFFTRRGGVSSGDYASLNCSLSGQDERAAVLENRARAARAVGAEPGRLLGLSQVHGAVCVTVEHGWEIGAGPAADAMVTKCAGLALGIVTADCAPVLFADAHAGIVGAAHAGWRGAVAGVLEATVEAMVALGSVRGQISAAIGPCIQAASYEVTADLRDAVLQHDASDEACFTAGRDAAHWQFDLSGYGAGRLRRAGIGLVVQLPQDTQAEAELFFSHRRRTLAGGGAIGHQISIVRCPI
jgi:YfiH family protein